eukprot:323259-Prorocentrum_minimum.AAC.3
MPSPPPDRVTQNGRSDHTLEALEAERIRSTAGPRPMAAVDEEEDEDPTAEPRSKKGGARISATQRRMRNPFSR